MKAIMISIKPKWCAKIMNKEKTIEVRKNKALAKAIQKLIDENGYADIYVYCSKNGVDRNGIPTELVDYRGCAIYNRFQLMQKGVKATSDDEQPRLNGKVIFKFRCYKVEEINYYILTSTIDYGVSLIKQIFATKTLSQEELEKLSCLTWDDLMKYLNASDGYAIHISHLKIFVKPKELREFNLKRAPQNFCYVEVE